MLPAPGQGAICIVCKKNYKLIDKIKSINDNKTFIETTIERDFMNALNVGCSHPIAALANISGNNIKATAKAISVDGTKIISTTKNFNKENWQKAGRKIADILIKKGAKKIIQSNR